MTTDHIASLLDPNCPLTTETRIWLATSFRLHLEKNIPLHRALAFDRRAYLLARRNHHLVAAFGYTNKTHKTRSRCMTLLKKLNQYSQLLHDYTDPDPEWSPLETEIFHALNCRIGFPDLRMLIDICKKCEILRPHDCTKLTGGM